MIQQIPSHLLHLPAFERRLFVNDVVIGHKADTCIIRGHNFLPQSLRRNMNQFNTLNGDEPTETSIYWKIQPPEVHFQSQTSPPKTSPVVLAIMERLNHRSIDNADVEVYPHT